MRIILPLALACAVLAGCANPIEQVRTTDGRPSIVLQDAPSDAQIFIDDRLIGKGSDYAAKAIMLDNGTHVVKVVSGGTTLLWEKIYVSGSATKRLLVLKGTQ